MTDIEAAAKRDVAAARKNVRAWMADHPFLWGAIAAGAGALVVALAAVAL